MPFNTPPTLASGDTWSAADHNLYIRDNLEFLHQAVQNPALKLIQKQTLASDAASVSFSSLPSQYRQLRLFLFGRTSEAAVQSSISCRCNNDLNGNYDRQVTIFTGTGSISTASVFSNETSMILGKLPGNSAPASAAGCIEATFFWSTSRFNKTVNSKCTYRTGLTAGTLFFETSHHVWKSILSITQLQLFCSGSSNFKAGSIFSLYGQL